MKEHILVNAIQCADFVSTEYPAYVGEMIIPIKEIKSIEEHWFILDENMLEYMETRRIQVEKKGIITETNKVYIKVSYILFYHDMLSSKVKQEVPHVYTYESPRMIFDQIYR